VGWTENLRLTDPGHDEILRDVSKKKRIMIVIPGLRIILAELYATCGNKMERMTLHERVINETVTIMNAVFSKLEVSLIIKVYSSQ